MHALVFVIGDKVHEQLKAQLAKRIDFYRIGGRWSELLPRRRPDGTVEQVDSLRAGEIAWTEALAEAEAAARKAFAEWREICERHGRPKSRIEISRELGLASSLLGDYPDQVYARYREQPALRAYAKAHPENIYCPIHRFGFDEDQFVRNAVAARLTPFALLIDGHWIEGPVGLDAPEHAWCAAVRDRLRSLDPDTRVTVADCHM